MAKIAIDAGHGLYTSGKRCKKSLDPKETREWVLNDRIADELGRLLQSAGHTILRVDDPTGKKDITLASRVAKANNWKADFYISVHHNAGVGGGTGGGTEVYVSIGCSSKSIKAQNAIYKHVIEHGKLKGNRSDGTKSANFYVVRNTKMPACLIECGFMDSKTDIKYILNPDWADKVALGIAEGICDVFGGTVNESAAPVAKPKPSTSKPASSKPNKPAKLAVDGWWGVATTKAAQYVMGTEIDGEISNQPLANKKVLTYASGASWEFKESGWKAGSALIRALQRLIGAVVDGYFGKNSVKALQKFLKARGFYTGLISGKLTNATVKGFQKYLNDRMGY